MAFIYAMSDIHGHLDIFKETLKNVDLQEKDNKLILLGDYIDRGKQSVETLYFIKEFSEIIKYISEDEYKAISYKCDDCSDELLRSMMMYKYVIDLIKSKHKNLLRWLEALPYFYETKNQIFVHAGIEEETEENWKFRTSDDCFTWKYPPTIGKSYKDIIAGHTHTSEIANDENYHKVFWDKESHFYIDGATIVSKFIPLLKYDTNTKRYSSFKNVIDENGTASWIEYLIS